MSRIIYFDCFSGISGDMALGALLDAGLSLEALQQELRRLNVDGWEIQATREVRGPLAGTRAHVIAPEQAVHRHLHDIRAIIESSALAPSVAAQSLRVFTLLAEAEARIHGTTPDQIHFHEVGALDAIVDIVGVVAGLALLGVEQVFASPVPLGTGWVRSAHGPIPVPAPATLALLAGVGAPITADEMPFELTTPTGAALLAGLAAFRRPPMRVTAVGYGFGARQLERPNALRAWLGELDEPRRAIVAPASAAATPAADTLVLLETNIDDQSGEQLAYALERLRDLGALDVWLTPIQMKKGRPAVILSALAPAELEERAVALILRETTTFGMRRRAVERHICDREIVEVTTPLGVARVKRKSWRGETLGAAPEYEDCARLARDHSVPLAEVYRIVARAAEAY